MDNIKFLGYKPEFIENDRSYPEIVRAINSDKYYNMEEMLGMIRNAKASAELNAFSKGYDKLYIDLIFDVDGTKKRWHGIRIDINDHSKPDEQFLDYARNIPSIIGAVFDTNDYSARYGNLSVFEGVNRDTIQEKDYKWIKLPFITKGTVFGKVGRRIGIAAPTTLPSSEGPIPGPGATSGECSGCSEGKLTEEWVNHLSEESVGELLALIGDFIYEIEDNFMHIPEIHTEEVRDKVYSLYHEILEYLNKYYPDSYLIKKYNLVESLKEDVSTSRPTLQQIFDEGQLDGIDVYDTDYDVDGCYVPNIQTPADNYDAFVKYFCQNSYVDEYDDDYATVNFCDFIKNNKAALDEWLGIDPEWDEDDAEEYIVEQLITALAGNGSESQYREFMTLLQTK